jgi:hypothetical protein
MADWILQKEKFLRLIAADPSMHMPYPATTDRRSTDEAEIEPLNPNRD